MKRTERLYLWDALAQAKSDAREGEVPLVVHRENDCPWVVILRFEDFLDIYTEAMGEVMTWME